MGKTVIAIDLNPLSRTAQCAHVTIVDNVVRAIPNLTGFAQVFGKSGKDELQKHVKGFDNKKNLADAIDYILLHLSSRNS
jgi:4-phosphopantoate--beta-alanine ligase